MSFGWLKLVHLSAAIIWCASAVGAFWYVIVAWWERRKGPEDRELIRRDEWVRWQFLWVVIVEHLVDFGRLVSALKTRIRKEE